MALNVQQTLIDALWSMLEARAGAGQFAQLVLAGNRIKSADADADALEPSENATTYPSVRIRGTGGTTPQPPPDS